MSLLDLLERWAEVEPAPRKSGTVLDAVIEAIEARGWDWSVSHISLAGKLRELFECKVTADVWWDPSTDTLGPFEGDSPAEALLTAYLNALKKAEGSRA